MASVEIKRCLAVAALLLAPALAFADSAPTYESPDEPAPYQKGPRQRAYRSAPYKTPTYKTHTLSSYYNWTGPYVGVYGGWGRGSSTWDSPAVSNNPTGGMFGATLGYAWQVSSLVYGVEGDIGWSGLKSSAACGAFACETRNQYLGTLRGRAGYAFDRFLPYLTGGLAIGDIRATSSNPAFTGGSDTKLGWTLGGGLEYAFMSRWTLKAEYLYANLGSIDCAGCGPTAPNNVSLTANIVRVGLNYKFGSGAISSRW